MDRQSRETGRAAGNERTEAAARMQEDGFDLAGKPDEGGLDSEALSPDAQEVSGGTEARSLKAGGPKSETDSLESGSPEFESGSSKPGSPESEAGSSEPGSPEFEAGSSRTGSPESEAGSSEPGTPESESGSGPADGSEADGQEPEKKKGFFAKKKDKKDEQIEDLNDRLRRSMAEFDNYRKRTEKEKAAMYEIGAKDMIEKILLVVDNFERGLATIPEGEEKSAFAEGMDKIYKQLLKMLEDVGVTSIESVGRPFDPNYHNAVMHIEDESLGENIVAEEFQKGYLYRDNVVRHSMVKVAN